MTLQERLDKVYTEYMNELEGVLAEENECVRTVFPIAKQFLAIVLLAVSAYHAEELDNDPTLKQEDVQKACVDDTVRIYELVTIMCKDILKAGYKTQYGKE